jgi:hypothetical protein
MATAVVIFLLTVVDAAPGTLTSPSSGHWAARCCPSTRPAVVVEDLDVRGGHWVGPSLCSPMTRERGVGAAPR